MKRERRENSDKKMTWSILPIGWKGLEASACCDNSSCLRLPQIMKDLDWGTQSACSIPPIFDLPSVNFMILILRTAARRLALNLCNCAAIGKRYIHVYLVNTVKYLILQTSQQSPPAIIHHLALVISHSLLGSSRNTYTCSL